MTFLRRTAAALCLLPGLAMLVAPEAAAAPVCPGAGQPTFRVGQVPGPIEGVTVDAQGRLYATTIDAAAGRIFRIDRPGAPAVLVATVPGSTAGALAWAADGGLLAGVGDLRVLNGDAARAASVARVDVNTGAVSTIATGLSASNGMAVGKDGIIYATNDFGALIGRVYPNGAVQPDWARLPSANGAALSADGRYLYVSRTFTNPGVSRIPIANPAAPESVVTFTGGDFLSAPDGLTLDSRDRPVVPLNASGQVIRVDGPNQFCVLGTTGITSSVLTYGRGNAGFAAGRLYRAGFDGSVLEVPGGFDPKATAANPGR